MPPSRTTDTTLPQKFLPPDYGLSSDSRDTLRPPDPTGNGPWPRAAGAHDAPVSRSGPQALRALHPEGVLAPELREEARQGGGRVVPGEQAHHREEERRLRTAQIVRPHAVGNVAVGVDQIGEVANHVLDQIMPPTLLQTEHREVRVPVVHLAEPPARDDIRPRRG